jgi:hypothetical protein
LLLTQLTHFALYAQTFDVTFINREPILEVTLAQEFANALSVLLMYDKHLKRLSKLLKRIKFSDGIVCSASEIWTLNYMPANLDISNVDISAGEQVIGDGGETIREIIRHTYRCKSRAEEDHFLLRWLAS